MLTPASDARFSSLVDVGKLQVIARIPSGNDRVASASYSHDGKRVAVGGWDNRILVVSAKDGRVESTLLGHSDWVNAVAFSADDKTVVSASNDSTVRFWSPAGALLSTLPHRAGVTRVQFVDERHVLSSTSDGSLHLWLTETTAPVATLYGHVSILSADELAGHEDTLS